MTPSYEPRYYGITNEISRTTEKGAVWNVDRDADLLRKSELLDLTMSRPPSIQREVIQRSYMDAGLFLLILEKRKFEAGDLPFDVEF